MTSALLDNIVWHSLIGPHAVFASGTNTIRRYARGYSQLVGFADCVRPDFAALTPWSDAGEHLYCSGWTGEAPADWSIAAEGPADILVWDRGIPDDDDSLRAIRLQFEHVPQAHALVE